MMKYCSKVQEHASFWLNLVPILKYEYEFMEYVPSPKFVPCVEILFLNG